MEPIQADDSDHERPSRRQQLPEVRDSSYGTMELEENKVPSNLVVSLSVILILGAAFLLIAGIGMLFIHDKKAINNLLDGLLAAYLLAFFLSIILGGGTAFLYLPQMLSNALPERNPSILEHDELA